MKRASRAGLTGASPALVFHVKIVYLSLGSNIGDREAKPARGHRAARRARLACAARFPTYETEPVDYTDQRWFLNLVVEAETDVVSVAASGPGAEVERVLGRVRTVPKGPRTIDIDILLYGAAVMRSGKLEIPHPRMAERRFVLVPLPTSPRTCAIRSRATPREKCWKPRRPGYAAYLTPYSPISISGPCSFDASSAPRDHVARQFQKRRAFAPVAARRGRRYRRRCAPRVERQFGQKMTSSPSPCGARRRG